MDSTQSAAFDADDPANDPIYHLRLLANGIERALATSLVGRTNGAGKTAGYVVAEVPDWALRQWHDHVVIVAQAIEARKAQVQP